MYFNICTLALFCYCIGYTSNDWSTSEIPLNQYQEKLQERQRREIEQLRCTLQEKERELQEERRKLEQVTG